MDEVTHVILDDNTMLRAAVTAMRDGYGAGIEFLQRYGHFEGTPPPAPTSLTESLKLASIIADAALAGVVMPDLPARLLREMLVRYGGHQSHCPPEDVDNPNDCGCGWTHIRLGVGKGADEAA